MATEVSRLYTQGEVAALLSISKRAVRRLGDEGTLTVVRCAPHLPRYRPDEVHRFMQGLPPKPES